MKELAEIIKKYGLSSVIMVVFLYQFMFLQNKLVSIVENNTKAIVELKSSIDTQMQYIHKDSENHR